MISPARPQPDPAPEQIGQEETRRWRRTVARLVALVTTASLAFVGVSSTWLPADEAVSAPRLNVRCDELIDGIEGIADLTELPGPDDGLPDGHTERIADYEYENPAEKLREYAEDDKEPTDRELRRVGTDYKNYPVGSYDRMVRRWNYYLQNGSGQLGWQSWVNQYIPNQSADARGDGFHRNVARRLKLGGDDWMCEDTSVRENRRYDAANKRLKLAYELKSGSSQLKIEQLQADRALQRQGWRVAYVFSQDPKPGQVRLLRQYGIRYTVMRSTAVPTNPPKSPSNTMNPRCPTPANPAKLTTLSTACQQSTRGPAKNLALRSGRDQAEANRIRQVNQNLGQEGRRLGGFRGFRPGGVDWTSLELRYVSDDPGNDDFAYSFAADELPEDAEPGFGGEAALDLSSDALFTWLALDPSQFWVNLNPDEPDRIIDEQFATTDAGRVLLEADLAFKRTIADQMDPESEVGAEFWEALERTDDGLVCHDGFRFWVDPRPATVREDGDQLYIVDAPLRARIEPMDFDFELPGEDLCAGAPQDVVDRNNQLLADTYAPILEEAVNDDPQYADLRRVYTARVAAEWIKARDAVRPGAFHDVIGSGDVSAWPARTPWDPHEVYDDYMERLQTPLYRYEWTHGEQEWWLEIMGGVILDEAPRDGMPAERFEEEHPRLPDTVDSARFAATTLPAALQDTDEVSTLATDDTPTAWLGGGTFQEVAEPDPTPDPSDPPSSGEDGDDPPASDDGGDDSSGGGNDSSDGGGAGGDGNDPSGQLPRANPPGDGAGPTYQATTPPLARTGFEGGPLLPLVGAFLLLGSALTWAGVRLRRRH